MITMNVIRRPITFLVRPTSVIRYTSTGCINYKKQDFDNIFHQESHEQSIPPYIEREGENADLKRARLIYQSRKRGMLENGLLLSTFAKKYLNNFNDSQLKLYDRLINLPSNDWDIFYWATGAKPTPPEFDHEVMDLLKKHIRNEDKQARIMQPEL